MHYFFSYLLLACGACDHEGKEQMWLNLGDSQTGKEQDVSKRMQIDRTSCQMCRTWSKEKKKQKNKHYEEQMRPSFSERRQQRKSNKYNQGKTNKREDNLLHL